MKSPWYILPEFYAARAAQREGLHDLASEGGEERGTESLTCGALLRARRGARGAMMDTEADTKE